jgi:hypothetical protein
MKNFDYFSTENSAGVPLNYQHGTKKLLVFRQYLAGLRNIVLHALACEILYRML